MNVNADRNYSAATGASGTVNYENYLLPLTVRQTVRNSTTGNQYRVRIVEDEANVANNNDTWANDNYAVFDFSPSGTYDFIGNGGWAINTPIINSKIFGKTYTSLGSGAGGNYVSFDGQSWAEAYTYNAGGARVISHQATPPSHAFSYTNSNASTTNTNLTAIDDVWGMYGDSTINHHIGKCDADDYQGATECAGNNRRAHSFNGGKGRFVQWFVK